MAAAGILIAMPAAAQQIDQCTLTPGPDPLAPLVQKLMCRLQIEDNARVDVEGHLVVAQADQQIAEGKAARLGDQIEAASRRLAWWANYDKGISRLASRVLAACAWRGVQNKPMAELCRARAH